MSKRCWIKILSSLRDLLFWLDDLPSHKWLGYFQIRFEFENWAVIALGGIPNKTQVGDMGIDGRIFPVSASVAPRKSGEGKLALQERWYPIQVKQKDKAGRPDIDAFQAVMMRENCEKGFFVSFDYSDDALREADAFFRRTGKSIVLFTVKDILEEQLARKLV